MISSKIRHFWQRTSRVCLEKLEKDLKKKLVRLANRLSLETRLISRNQQGRRFQGVGRDAVEVLELASDEFPKTANEAE
jgi:hypothetical protein